MAKKPLEITRERDIRERKRQKQREEKQKQTKNKKTGQARESETYKTDRRICNGTSELCLKVCYVLYNNDTGTKTDTNQGTG